MHAAISGQDTSVRLLIDAGADVNKTDVSGRTALLYVLQDGHEMCVELLFKAEADVNIRDKFYRTALNIATKLGSNECVEMLIKSGVDVNKVEWQHTSDDCYNLRSKWMY